MQDHIAITIHRVSKDFILPHNRANTLKTSVLKFFKNDGKAEVQHALQNVSLEIAHGEFFGITGRNGSGKSTLLKMLAGIYQPTKGKIDVNGKLVPFIELGVGFNPELTGRENVYLNGAILGFSEAEIHKMYPDIVEFSELKRFMDQKLKNYSSGMQVRLAFSVAIRANADILLIDEVLAVGDAAFQRKCFDYFRQLKKDKRTVVFVSHDMDAIRQFCDRAVLIDKSNLIMVDDASRVADAYSKMFIEEAANNDPAEVTENNKKRLGSGAVRFEDVKVSRSTVVDDTEFLEFGGNLVVNMDIEKPILGFRIADASGNLITGTNSQLLHMKLEKYMKGQVVPFSWKLPNIFSNGFHHISLAAVSESDEALDVFDDAIKFEVLKSIRTPYVVTPKIELSVSNTVSASKKAKGR